MENSMFGKIITGLAGRSIARSVGGTSAGPLGAALGAALPMVLPRITRRLGPVGMIATVAGGYLVKKWLEGRKPATAAALPATMATPMARVGDGTIIPGPGSAVPAAVATATPAA
jgi:hypothetical protein